MKKLICFILGCNYFYFTAVINGTKFGVSACSRCGCVKPKQRQELRNRVNAMFRVVFVVTLLSILAWGQCVQNR